jgi:hypothetical protein
MFEGFKSRWTTPAEWTYFSPRYLLSATTFGCGQVGLAYQDLVEEVLDELLLERSGGEEAVQVGAEQFGDKIAVSRYKPDGCSQVPLTDIQILKRRDEHILQSNDLYSLSACSLDSAHIYKAYVLMLEMLQQLQLTVCALREDRCAEWLHDLLYSHRLAGELIFCRADP